MQSAPETTRPWALASRVMKARHTSTCPTCGQLIRIGDRIALTTQWEHIGHVITRQPRARDL